MNRHEAFELVASKLDAIEQRVRRYALSRGHNDPEDVVQDVMTGLLDKIDRGSFDFSRRDEVVGLAVAMARGQCHKRRRRKSQIGRQPFQAVDDAVALERSITDRLGDAEMRRCLEARFDGLLGQVSRMRQKPRDMAVRAILGDGVQEVAEKHQVAPSTVRSAASRAKGHLIETAVRWERFLLHRRNYPAFLLWNAYFDPGPNWEYDLECRLGRGVPGHLAVHGSRNLNASGTEHLFLLARRWQAERLFRTRTDLFSNASEARTGAALLFAVSVRGIDTRVEVERGVRRVWMRTAGFRSKDAIRPVPSSWQEAPFVLQLHANIEVGPHRLWCPSLRASERMEIDATVASR